MASASASEPGSARRKSRTDALTEALPEQLPRTGAPARRPRRRRSSARPGPPDQALDPGVDASSDRRGGSARGGSAQSGQGVAGRGPRRRPPQDPRRRPGCSRGPRAQLGRRRSGRGRARCSGGAACRSSEPWPARPRNSDDPETARRSARPHRRRADTDRFPRRRRAPSAQVVGAEVGQIPGANPVWRRTRARRATQAPSLPRRSKGRSSRQVYRPTFRATRERRAWMVAPARRRHGPPDVQRIAPARGSRGNPGETQKSWRRPIFPKGCPLSIFGAGELDFRVRDGNGYGLSASVTRIQCVWMLFGCDRARSSKEADVGAVLQFRSSMSSQSWTDHDGPSH